MPARPDRRTSAELTAAYASRIDADLLRVDAEIAELRAQLETLDADRALLVRLRGSLPGVPPAGTDSNPDTDTGTDTGPKAGRAAATAATAPPAGPIAEPPAPAVPEQRADPAVSDAGPAPQPVPRQERGAPGSGSTLVELVRQYLRERGGPVSVSEVSAMLQSHPSKRQVSNVVVRNTLETLVAKSVAARSKQGNSVFYTFAATTAAAGGAATGGAAAGNEEPS